jgi:hypothetical protein
VGLVADTDLLAGLAFGFPMAEQNVGFPKLVNNLFGVLPFLWHGSDLLGWPFATFDLGQLFQTRSTRCARDKRRSLEVLFRHRVLERTPAASVRDEARVRSHFGPAFYFRA